MIRRPPRSTQSRSSAASDVYKRQVYAATASLIETMSDGDGGYILAASHTVPPETPDDNIFAMYRAAGISREEIFDRAAAIRAS